MILVAISITLPESFRQGRGNEEISSQEKFWSAWSVECVRFFRECCPLSFKRYFLSVQVPLHIENGRLHYVLDTARHLRIMITEVIYN